MTALCVWYSQHVSDSDMSWHGAAGEQLQCACYYYRHTAIRVYYPRWIKALRGSGLIQPANGNNNFSVQWLRRWAGLTHMHTLQELYYLLIYLSLCHWMIRQNTGEPGTSSWFKHRTAIFNRTLLFPCDWTLKAACNQHSSPPQPVALTRLHLFTNLWTFHIFTDVYKSSTALIFLKHSSENALPSPTEKVKGHLHLISQHFYEWGRQELGYRQKQVYVMQVSPATKHEWVHEFTDVL